MNKIKYVLPVLLLSVVVGISQLAHADFLDVDSNHTYYDGIQYVRSQGIVNGYEDNTYQPDRTINRAEFTKIIIESQFEQVAISQCKTSSFKDVSDGEWFTPYVCMAKKHEIIQGYSDNTFRPSQEISFVEGAKIIVKGFKFEVNSDDIWYKPFVNKLSESNAIPIEIRSFESPLTRGQMAEMIYRLKAGISNKSSLTYADLNGENETEVKKQYCGDNGCNEITITTDAHYRYIKTNNIPNHETGQFPNPGNPNSITEQNNEYRITLNPKHTGKATAVQVPGVSLNGVFFEPGTAERNGEWNYEAFQNKLNLGLDENNAHVQPNGSYHYHGTPNGLINYIKMDDEGELLQVGWASDGFPMWYSTTHAYKSSYQLKSGTRATNPYGKYDGTYTQDFEYKKGSEDLDECNGMTIDGNYGYMITEDFPYITRCVFGTPDTSFNKGPGGAGPTGGRNQNGPQSGPPAGAFDACENKSNSDTCSFTDGGRTITGSCRNVPEGFVCAP